MQDFEDDLAARNRIVEQIVLHLARAEYDQVAACASRSRITPMQMQAAVDQYGRKLAPLPAHGFDLIDYVVIVGSTPLAWSVVVPLFTQEGERCDLSLELRLTETADGGYEVELKDMPLHEQEKIFLNGGRP